MIEYLDISVNNLNERYTLNEFAKQADGSLLLQVNDTVMLATAVMDENVIVDEEFLPLTVQYIEKAYATGKIPGGFVKREQKPSEFETLTSRIIDRSLRPLFPKGYKHPTVITVMVLSADNKTDLQVMALNAAANALLVSAIPIDEAVCALRVGRIGGEFVLNPTPTQLADSTLDLFVSGKGGELLMIEQRAIPSEEIDGMVDGTDFMVENSMGGVVTTVHRANEIDEESLIEALKIALEGINECSTLYKNSFNSYIKPHKKAQIIEDRIHKEIYEYLKTNYKEATEEALFKMSKSERTVELKEVAKRVQESEYAVNNEWSFDDIYRALGELKRELLRENILFNGKRADGRGLDDIRDIAMKTNFLPSVHGSALFTRGQTQALVTCTIGGDQDAQVFELLTEKSSRKDKFMVHYNFPGFSVNEASPIGPTGRRELGHGNLAKRALEPTLMQKDRTIRLVSEILESNGSSSMATVCGGSLALKAANIEVSDICAGVAMGLVQEGSNYAVLTDIMGLEDHDGDLDCKIAGTKNGITAMQMDIKLGGLDFEVLKDVLYKAKIAREKILFMMEEEVLKIKPSSSLPSSMRFFVHPSKIVDIIGQAGKTIKEIIERFEVSIDLDRDKGEVKVSGSSKEKVSAASEHIKSISASSERERVDVTKLYTPNEVVSGRVKRVVDFGAFVALPKGFDGLLHISKLAEGKRIENIANYIKEGDEVEVKIVSVSKNRVELALLHPLI